MLTVVLNLYTKAYPLITNDIRTVVYKQTDPQAFVAQEIDSTPGHPTRIWSFPGLPRENYGVSIDEIDGSGNVLFNLANFAVVPSEVEGLLTRPDEQITADVTTGFNSGVNSFVFDGTGGKPNYIGWTIVPSELTGRGILNIDEDYTWDPVTGTFELSQAGDLFAPNQVYNIHFNPYQQPAGNSVGVYDFAFNFLDSDATIDSSYFGKKLIVEPSSVYIEITLPDIATVVVGRPLMVEISPSSISSIRCVKFVTTDTLNWIHDTMYAYPGESFYLYKYQRPDTSLEWRICNAYGNWRQVGTIIYHDNPVQGHAILLNGASIFNNQYARLFTQFVEKLPADQLVDYDNWGILTGSRTFFSIDNSANPANANRFRIPDRRSLFARATGKYQGTVNTPETAGTYQSWAMQDHKHKQTVGNITSGGYGTSPNPENRMDGGILRSGQSTDLTSTSVNPTTGQNDANLDWETRPMNYSINQFILI